MSPPGLRAHSRTVKTSPLNLSADTPVHSSATPKPNTPERSLSNYQCLGLPTGLFLPGLVVATLYTVHSSQVLCQSQHTIMLDLVL